MIHNTLAAVGDKCNAPLSHTVKGDLAVHAELTGLQRGTLHVILTEDHESALVLSASAQQRLPQATAVIAPQSQVSDLMDEVNAGAGNRRAVTAAVIAQLAATDDVLAQSGETPQSNPQQAYTVVLALPA